MEMIVSTLQFNVNSFSHLQKALFRRAQGHNLGQDWDAALLDLDTLVKLSPKDSAVTRLHAEVTRSKKRYEKKQQAAFRGMFA